MPARSKSQQRLFGAVHAYNEGKFHGSRAFRQRVAALARHISAEDARHFAETPHDGLPEKKEKRAQVMVSPETMREMYGRLPLEAYGGTAVRSARRRSVLGLALSGAVAGATLGGLAAGGAGAIVARGVGMDKGLSPDALRDAMVNSGVRTGVWGAGNGAAAGAVLGAGLGIFNKLMGD